MASLLRQIVAGPRSRHPEAGLDLCYVTDQIIATSGPSGTYPQRAYRNPLDQLVKFLDYKHGENWAIWEFRAEGTGYPDSEVYGRVWHYPWPDHHPPPFRLIPMIMAGMRNWLHEESENGKAGEKGKKRNGRLFDIGMWMDTERALARFTERRMRPGFGQGVSIPSQLRWVGYVDRWTQSGKVYVERQIEVMEVHIWGLRDGVKVAVEGFVDEGKTIKIFHVFTKRERVIVEGNAPGGGGLKDKISNMAGFQNEGKVPKAKTTSQMDGATITNPNSFKASSSTSVNSTGSEVGGTAVIFKPSTRVILPTSDVNIDFERRNKASMGWTMVTAVAHVWFNVFFEGNGPEQNGSPDENGVFEIDWDKMDGIKGSSRKGTRAFDRLAVIWRAYDPEPGRGRKEDVIHEPGAGSPVAQMRPADWKGANETSPGLGKDLGLRTESPASAEVSKASSIKSADKNLDSDSEKGVRLSGPSGEEDLEVDIDDLPQPQANSSEPSLADMNAGLDTASSTTPQRGSKVPISTQNMDGSSDLVGGISAMLTSELPDGAPEDQLKSAKEHNLEHLQSTRTMMNS
ncbi:hypothetical protein G7Y89_g1506 [Cudoniella acicularis]|uniref:Phosphatase tensin-type domain-containing protein n=1 Tax=Cudoniella acicularis TaxID=354080 RepID=A0A8H4RX42_9HELO|nr:hypothetical protein G7Y89_g1506 [Cudoniella acicularis]